MITKTSAIQQNILAAGGKDSLKSGLITCTLTGKNCAACYNMLEQLLSLHKDI